MKKAILLLFVFVGLVRADISDNKASIMPKKESINNITQEYNQDNLYDFVAPKNLNTYKQKLDYLEDLRYEVFILRNKILDKGVDIKTNLPYSEYIRDDDSAIRFNALAQAYSDGYAKTGFFVGAGVGMLDVFTSGISQVVRNPAASNNDIVQTLVVTRVSPFVYSFRGGYQRFLNHHIGARIYGGIFSPLLLFTPVNNIDLRNGANDFRNDLSAFYALGQLSVDLLFEVPIGSKFSSYIGGFAGISVGMMYYRTYLLSNNKPTAAPYIWDYALKVDYSFNLGASLTIANLHRFEISLNVPFAYLDLPGFAVEDSNIIRAELWRSALMSFNYHFVFRF